jgi:CheY-like chemotaxis protein
MVGRGEQREAVERLLLVEDDPGDAFLVGELLTEVYPDVELVVAGSMRDALARLDGADCVLLDLNLPGYAGLEGLRTLLASDPLAAVCVLTGLDDEHLGAAAVAAGAQDYLVKGKVDGPLLVRAIGVTTDKTAYRASTVVNCAGAWAGHIRPLAVPTQPVKGQMVCYAMPQKELLRHVVRSPEIYLIPRSDGRLLAGATVEDAGFDKRTVPETIQGLRRKAIALLPALEEARLLEDWAGLRPGTPDSLPILGRTQISGYFVATGHFRDGILLAPITARVMAEVINGRIVEFDLAPFALERFERTEVSRFQGAKVS